MSRPWSIRTRTLLAVVAFLSIAVSACAAPQSSTTTSGAASVIKAGVMFPLTGQGAASGTDMKDGWELYWQLNGNKLCGGKTTIQTIEQDTQGSPTVAVTKARAMVQQQGANFLVGALYANVGYALAQYAVSANVPYFSPVASADDLTQRKANPLVLRIAGWSSSQPSHPFAQWVAQNYPQLKNWMTIGPDYLFGYENIGGFVQVMSTSGGTFKQQLWAPLGTNDFSPYLSQVTGVDAVYAAEVGSDSIHFLKAWSDFGYKNKIPLFGSENLTDQSLLHSMGSYALGTITAGHFAEGRNDPATQNFDAAFEKAYGRLPSYYAAALYTSAQWLAQALTSINCNISNQSKFLSAVKSVKLSDSPFGPMSLDQYGNPIENIYIRKVEMNSAGQMWNVPIYTFTNVSQFGSCGPSTYLQQPAYSKTFQGIGKSC